MVKLPNDKMIYKYTLKVTDVQTVKMPKGACVLTAQTQHSAPCIWVEVDPLAPVEDRTVVIYGTGHPMARDQTLDYVGTVQLHGGDLVFHVYIDRPTVDSKNS